MKKTLTNNKGFTLIELMIVIAIIGILAAIAIPNFIAYRNKAFCSAAESDANAIAAAISDYYAIPAHTNVIAMADLNAGAGMVLSGVGAAVNTAVIGGPITALTITVTDGSTRCPADYQGAMTQAASPKGYWNAGTYVKTMQ